MTNFFLSLFIIIGVISACNIDDICIEPTTPNLVLRFYDATSTTTLKATDSLYVWAEGKDSLFINQTTDSLSIPLDVNATSTVYNLSKGTQLLNQLTINYTTQNQYLSRSCGYRVIYNNVTFTVNTTGSGWISSITPTELTTINNQTTAHVQVFH